jgi:hypothetical protein
MEILAIKVNRVVREFLIGKTGVGFDRLDLDKWADAYISANSTEKDQYPHLC